MQKKMNNYHREEKIAKNIIEAMECGSPESGERVQEWINENPFAADVVSRVINSNIEQDVATYKASDSEKAAMAAILQRRLKRKSLTKHITLLTGSIAAAIAAIAVVIYLQPTKQNIANEVANNNQPLFDITTEEIKQPTIIKADGETINLDVVKKQLVSANTTIEKESNSSITIVGSNDVVEYSCLLVPKMTSYEIALPDGTKVTLNANSRLEFPNRFNGEKREVTLIGEAFFDVVKSDKPFVVKMKGADIKVYGTKFTANSDDNNTISTYLLEGSIGMVRESVITMVKPNELASLNKKDGTVSLTYDKNEAKYIGWLSNNFVFTNYTVKDIANQLSKWYGVTIEALDNNSTLQFEAQFSRDTPLEEIISSVERVIGKKSFNIEVPMKK